MDKVHLVGLYLLFNSVNCKNKSFLYFQCTDIIETLRNIQNVTLKM